MKWRTLAVALVVWSQSMIASRAQSAPSDQVVSEGSIGLRGGYDTNPTDMPGAHGSAFVTETASYDYLRGSLAGDGLGLKINVSNTDYDPNVAAPSTSVLVAATKAVELTPDLNLRSTLTTAVDDNWARRMQSAQWRNRIEYDTSDVRVFANIDASLSALNERDIFTASSFLPEDENFVTATAMPGFAYKFNGGEVGTSVAFSRVAYLAPDIFGLDRSHDVVQPNAFFSAKVNGIELEGSLSPYLAVYDTADFDTVRQLLYTAKIRYPSGPWTVGIGSSRTIQDTTLPFVSLDSVLAHEASVSYKLDDKNAISLLARYRRDDFLGIPDLWSTVVLTGIDYAHDFGDGLIGTAGVSVRQVTRPGEYQPLALNLQFGLQKKLDFGNPPKPPAQDVAHPARS
jgi:Putative beta-barrel porin 2